MSLKQDIMAAIGETNDPNMKIVLLFMLGMMEEIVGKIDAMRDDEKGLREAVLNGHADNHDHHHEWVAKKIKAEESDAEADKASARKIRDGLVEKLLWVALVFVAGASGWMFK